MSEQSSPVTNITTVRVAESEQLSCVFEVHGLSLCWSMAFLSGVCGFPLYHPVNVTMVQCCQTGHNCSFTHPFQFG
jgi:hypothetical protein